MKEYSTRNPISCSEIEGGELWVSADREVLFSVFQERRMQVKCTRDLIKLKVSTVISSK